MTKKWQDQYDAAAEAEIKSDPELASRVNQLQDIYSKIQEAQASGASREVYDNVINWARAMGDVSENILNNENVKIDHNFHNHLNCKSFSRIYTKLQIQSSDHFSNKRGYVVIGSLV